MFPSQGEALYRAHFLRADARRTVLVVLVAIVGMLAFIPNDVRFVGWSRDLAILLAMRATSVVVDLVVVVVLLRSSEVRAHDRAIAVLLANVVVANAYVVSTRPPEYIGHGITTLLAVVATYFLTLGPLSTRVIASVLFSFTTFWFSLRAQVPVAGLTAVGVAHVLTHGIAFPAALRIDRSRREAFFSQLEEKRARAELAAKAADLEVAKERAEALARTKSDFLATMSHEFRTPMNAVLGLSGALSDTALSASQRELVRTIHRSASSLLVLLNDILDLAKIEAGRLDVEQAPFEVRAVIESALDMVRYQASEKCLTLEVDVAPEVPAGLAGDEARLRQVLVNLLSNAVKFTRSGTVSLRGSARPLGEDEHEVVLVIRDTGVGMPPELLDRLFSPFEQARGGRAGDRTGTGLGLAITRRLVDLMGGSIRVESEEGRGSMFEITLRARAAEPPPRASRSSITPVDPSRALRTLVVDDNEINQRVAHVLLARLGVKAELASSGEEALEAVRRAEYDLIFMDLRMPEMDGLTATRQILEELPPSRRPRVVAMTASAFEEDRAACREVGMDGFLEKPVRIEQLSALLAGTEPPDRQSAPAVPAAAAPRVETVLSKAALDTLRQLETPEAPGFFAETCRQFILDASRRVGAFERAVSSKDASAAERAVHTLKSMSATVGATRLSEMCGELESALHRGELPTDPAAAAHVRVELEKVSRALAREAEIEAPVVESA